MPDSWTTEQVINLAPDEASRKNARDLAAPLRWLGLSQKDGLVWGEVRGSGSDPYRCQVDVAVPAFQCSCPSRKLPCKHALGLFLLFTTQPGIFQTVAPPAWVTEWLARRAARADHAAARAKTQPQPSDPAEQARKTASRIASRDQKIRAGLDDLETWLADLVRQGLAAAQEQPRKFWEMAAARLVDAQAPGLARLVRQMADLPASGGGWEGRLLDQVGRLYLALEGYRRIQDLPPETQADLRSLVGITLKQEDLLGQPGLADTWLILGRQVEEETGLKTQRTWLVGQSSGRPALVLSFALPGAALDTSLPPGLAVQGKLVFYPGAFPLRALVQTRQAVQPLPPDLPGCSRLVEAAQAYAAGLAGFPWLERYPMALRSVTPVWEDGEWALYDADHHCAWLARSFPHGWTLAAISGGRPIGLFGEWDGERLLPLSAWSAGQFYPFQPTMD